MPDTRWAASDVVRRMEEKYRALGGSISFNSKVSEIIVAGGRAAGIRSNGRVIAPTASSQPATQLYAQKMLRGMYRHPQLDAAC